MSILLIHVLSSLLADSPHQFLVASLISSCKVIPIDYNAAVALSVAHTTAGIFRHTPDPIISPSYRETERTALAASCSYGLATAVIVEYAPCTYTKNRRSLLLRILLRDVK